MPSFCAVLNCADKYGHNRTAPFHKFPTKNKELLEKWICFTHRPKDWRPSKWTSVCGHHFRDEDYRCSEQKKMLKKTAVPSVRSTKHDETATKTKEKLNDDNSCLNYEDEGNDCNFECTPESPKNHEKISVKCRFCGSSTTTKYESFACNFEIYGIIQKCLPTLSIRQDDDLPKELCCKCLKRLESFACFIDKVLETQTKLQRQFRQEKGGGTKPIERALKIKQEPVCVRVKQEDFEDVNALFPDEVDDVGGEQENDNSISDTQLDQKIQFCDFPVLNDQDLINNCDIMEIINLSDPFIDITNCENTLADEEQQVQQQLTNRGAGKKLLQSAHELLQSHMLIEEHNYAFAAEDFKMEWQIKNCYKTEKIEAEEHDSDDEIVASAVQNVLNCDFSESGQYLENFGSFIDEAYAAEDVAAIATVETTALPIDDDMERSIKPIVTSVSSFNDNTITNYPQATVLASETIQGQQREMVEQQQPNLLTSRKRPNIVVLNESIVQSSHTFQLQACTICQSKFIGVDSLAQHYAMAHAMAPPTTLAQPSLPLAKTPMVTVPTENLSIAIPWQNNLTQHQQAPQQQLQQEPFKIEIDGNYNLSQNYDSSTKGNLIIPNKRSAKNEIKILDMQQSFLHQYNYQPSNLIRFEQQTNLNFNAPQFSAISAYPMQTQSASFANTNNLTTHDERTFIADSVNQSAIAESKVCYLNHNNGVNIDKSQSNNDCEAANASTNINGSLNSSTTITTTTNSITSHRTTAYIPESNMQPPSRESMAGFHDNISKNDFKETRTNHRNETQQICADKSFSSVKPKNAHPIVEAAVSDDLLTAKYKALRKSYALLRLKCQRLASKRTTIQKKTTPKPKLRFNCRTCNSCFSTIQQLLRHRQTAAFHKRKRRRAHFFASCPGCEKFFCHKVALFNHMRYICQSLPLSWFKSQLRSFKCRCCRLITFTHWRLYRRHEILCRKRRKFKAKVTKLRKKAPAKPQTLSSAKIVPSSTVQYEHLNTSQKSVTKKTSSSPCPQSQRVKRNIRNGTPHTCDICKKVFHSSSSLKQHRITHSNLRSFECEICKRNFKRRNGLTQHVRGYHFKLKPFECSVCKHPYALKGDVKRCKHSAMNRSKMKKS